MLNPSLLNISSKYAISYFESLLIYLKCTYLWLFVNEFWLSLTIWSDSFRLSQSEIPSANWEIVSSLKSQWINEKIEMLNFHWSFIFDWLSSCRTRHSLNENVPICENMQINDSNSLIFNWISKHFNFMFTC